MMNRSKGQLTVSKDHVCPPQTIHNIRKVNVSEASENLHLGTAVTLNGPVNIVGLTLQDIHSINGSINEKCKVLEQKDYLQRKKNKIDKSKPKKKIPKTCNLKKYLFLVLYLFLVQGVLIFFLANRNEQPESHAGLCVQKINEMNSKLLNFYPRKSWGIEHNCLYSSYIKNIKTKIKFVIVDPILWDCLFISSSIADKSVYTLCNKLFNIEFRNHMDKFWLNDIYYNYIVGYNGYIFEGRPLTCDIEKEHEIIFTEDRLNEIIVGIPYCFNDLKGIHKNTFSLAIIVLTDTLISAGILSKNYIMEFPDVCVSRLLQEMLKQHHEITITYSYIKEDIFNNIKKSEYVIGTLSMMNKLKKATDSSGSHFGSKKRFR